MRTRDLVWDNLQLTVVVMIVCTILGYGAGSAVVLGYQVVVSRVPTRNSEGGVDYGNSRAIPDAELAPYRRFRDRVTGFAAWAGLAAAQTTFLITHLRLGPVSNARPEEN